MVELSYPLSRP